LFNEKKWICIHLSYNPHFCSNPLAKVRVVPSGFVTVTVYVPTCFGVGRVNQALTCVGLSHATLLATTTTVVPVVLVSLAVKPCWKPVPIIVIGTSFPNVDTGLIVLIPPESVGGVVVVVLVVPWIENMLE
jgi:hypothetical protein